MKKYLWILILAVIVVAVFVMRDRRPTDEEVKSYSEMTAREVALTCTTDMATEFHIHPVLSIVINGEVEIIPADIGITNNCMNSLHTHDDSGELHVEAPVQKDFTLSDFFAVWNKPFSSTQIFDHVVDDTHEIVVTVNGGRVETYENTLLVDKDRIVISYQAK